jgi:hypothetical protein
MGRKTIRKNGVPYTDAERAKRYRHRTKRSRDPANCDPNNCEWNTPKWFVDAVRKVMGNIHCDPASSNLAQTVVQARHFYTVDDNGLAKEWHGNIYLNPPYARGHIDQFVTNNKLLGEIARMGM